jgi:hypothetical protein
VTICDDVVIYLLLGGGVLHGPLVLMYVGNILDDLMG